MRKYIYMEASQHDMKLIQMGAKVEQISSKMCYVKFTIDDIEVAYVYNINKKGRYFLERIKPYPIPLKEFEKEEDVIKIIDIDVRQFKNAAKSKNMENFIKINKELNKTIKEFEDLFLYYNVPKIEIEIIMDKIKEIHEEIYKTQKMSERVFFDKEPDNL
ncbi:hypothetical protein [Caminicella sporogenes]|uniref:hypothetical protein n=1 Tax=Caminicella sporogenes TaxID=166485 RepID=UPI000932F09F|nr:hypothetical protein [Caminicella sporogenes]RKD27185.1 hypothetical protein BET04_09730 [Caminicella sporogenes]